MNHELTTSLGLLEIVFTDANHCHVSYPRNSEITLRGVAYRVSCHLFRWTDNQFHVGREDQNTYERRQQLHVTRAQWVKVSDMNASESARTKIEAVVTMAANEFVKANPDAITAAQREYLQDKLEAAETKYAEAVAAADEARKTRDAAQASFETFVKEAA